MKKSVRSLVIALVLLVPLLWFVPYVTIPYLLLGLYDVARNRKLDWSKVRQYYVGNGTLTWLLVPFNTLLDLLCLPYINKGIYQLKDLPAPYRAEVERLIDAAHNEDLVGKLQEYIKDNPRSMIFFKWYGKNQPAVVDVPAFHEKFKYIKTIGVSVFNKKASTSRHFGPFRATLRVLYNVNDMHDKSAYIEVGDVKNYWQDSKLFIFDDTLLHQSFNETDQVRFNLFVDILRPSLVPWLLAGVVSAVRFFAQGVNHVFYKKWNVIKK